MKIDKMTEDGIVVSFSFIIGFTSYGLALWLLPKPLPELVKTLLFVALLALTYVCVKKYRQTVRSTKDSLMDEKEQNDREADIS